GRRWDVTVNTAGEERTAAKDRKAEAKTAARQAQLKADDAALLTALDKLAGSARCAVSYVDVRAQCGLSRDRMKDAFARLLADRIVRRATVKATIGNGAERDSLGIQRWREEECTGQHESEETT